MTLGVLLRPIAKLKVQAPHAPKCYKPIWRQLASSDVRKNVRVRDFQNNHPEECGCVDNFEQFPSAAEQHSQHP